MSEPVAQDYGANQYHPILTVQRRGKLDAALNRLEWVCTAAERARVRAAKRLLRGVSVVDIGCALAVDYWAAGEYEMAGWVWAQLGWGTAAHTQAEGSCSSAS